MERWSLIIETAARSLGEPEIPTPDWHAPLGLPVPPKPMHPDRPKPWTLATTYAYVIAPVPRMATYTYHAGPTDDPDDIAALWRTVLEHARTDGARIVALTTWRDPDCPDDARPLDAWPIYLPEDEAYELSLARTARLTAWATGVAVSPDNRARLPYGATGGWIRPRSGNRCATLTLSARTGEVTDAENATFERYPYGHRRPLIITPTHAHARS